MSSISVIILAKNEEQHIKDCIESAQFADEVLIIDDYSMDKTELLVMLWMEIGLNNDVLLLIWQCLNGSFSLMLTNVFL